MADFEDIISYPKFSWNNNVNYILEESSLDTLIMALNDPEVSDLVDIQHYLKKNDIDFARLFKLTCSFKILKKFIDYYARQNNLEFYSHTIGKFEIDGYCNERYSISQKRYAKIQRRKDLLLSEINVLLGYTTVEKLRNFTDGDQNIDKFLEKNKDTLTGPFYTCPKNNTDLSSETGQYILAHGGDRYYTFGCVADEKTSLSPVRWDKYSELEESHSCVFFVVEREKIRSLFNKKINIDDCLLGKMDKQTRKIFLYLCFFTGYEQTLIDDQVYYNGYCFDGYPFVNNVSLSNTNLFYYFRKNYRDFFETDEGREVAGGYGYW